MFGNYHSNCIQQGCKADCSCKPQQLGYPIVLGSCRRVQQNARNVLLIKHHWHRVQELKLLTEQHEQRMQLDQQAKQMSARAANTEAAQPALPTLHSTLMDHDSSSMPGQGLTVLSGALPMANGVQPLLRPGAAQKISPLEAAWKGLSGCSCARIFFAFC